MKHKHNLIVIIPLLCVSFLNLGAQTADEAPHRHKDGNKVPWYAPDPEGEGQTRSTVDLRFAPTETKMIGPSPAAAEATRYSDCSVSYALGLVDVSIPLYEIKSHSLTLPISLSYDSGGVRVDDISGPAGLNWTLEAGGVITRTVIGRDDTGTVGWTGRPDGDPTSPSFADTTYLSNLAFGMVDNAADLYSYSFCGHRGHFYVDGKTSPDIVIPTSATDLKIEVTPYGFTITDTDGTKYNFTQQEASDRYTAITSPILGDGSSPQYFPEAASPITAWYLTSIVAMDGTDEIDLTYETHGTLTTVRYYKLRTYQFSYRYRYVNDYLWLGSTGSWGSYPAVSHKTGDCQAQTEWEPHYVKTISYDGGEVTFSYKNNDITSTTTTRRSYPRVLSAMRVRRKLPVSSDTAAVRVCTFSMQSTLDLRNLLTGVTITGKNGTAIETYTLTYINGTTANMSSCCKDLFGYYNGASNGSNTAFLRLFESNSPFSEPMANRNYNASRVSDLSLETITTASGAKTKFFYEGNSVSAGGTGVLFSTIGVGHRIWKIATYDLSGGGETLVRSRQFTYASPSLTIPASAFTHSAFLTVTETFREDLAYGSPSWHGSTNPVPRMATVAFSDQSVLPGAPLENARICYGSVTERISNASGSGSVRTDYTFDTSSAVHPYSYANWVLNSWYDAHDTASEGPYGYTTHLYHFFQRPPQTVPRQSGTPSVDISQNWAQYYPVDFPQLTAPTTVRRYKTSGATETLISQTANTYSLTSEDYGYGIRSRDMIAIGDLSAVSPRICNGDFLMVHMYHKRVWHRLAQTTETEYLDDGSSHSAVTTYTYIPTSNVPAIGSILTPKTKTTVVDGDNTRTYAWTYTYPSEKGSSSPWPALVSNGYRRPVEESVTAGTGTGSATTTRAESWDSFSAKFSSSKTLLRPKTITIVRREPGSTTFNKGGPTVTYDAYDKWGNPVQITVDGQPTTTYIWGYGGQRPVLEVVGGSFAQVSSVLGTVRLNTIALFKPTLSQLSGARASLEGASSPMLVSWYLYDIPFGISQASDVSGRITKYTYDGAGRLSYVQDENDNRVSSYSYALTNGSSGSPNSINSYTHTAAGSSATAGVRDVAYFDGLGRTVQTIAVAAATKPTGIILARDLVTPVAPDYLDREDARAYLPYPAATTTTNAGTYRSGALSSQQAHYGSGVKAYTENTYEVSGRNRVVASSLPGFTQTTAVTTRGSEANTVLKLTFNASANTLSAAGYHAANRFSVTVTTGPDGSQTSVYTDEFGTPVLERVKINASTYADTYYIKDVLGRVLCVVPPAEAAKLSSSTSGYSAVNCYTYGYDARDRVHVRQLPGCVMETVEYNEADQPVSRTRLAAGSTSVNEVFTTAYDAFFRPTSETYKYGSNTPVTLAEYKYDSYPTWAPAFAAESGYVTAADTTSHTRGLKTAERLTQLPAATAPSGLTAANTSTKETRAFYYDAKGRVVQMARQNATGGTDRVSSSYGFAGNLLKERQKVQPASGAATYNLDRVYTYDARLRLTNVTATLNGGSTATQALTYDDLQRVASVNRGSGTETTALTYSLQGWLSSAVSTSWSENLYYASPSRTATDALPGLAGLVTEWKQQQVGTSSNGATTAETFAYAYDKAGRLTGSVRYLGTATTSDNKLTEQGIAYDRSGNLTALTRRNASGSATQTLSYSYNGPKRTTWTYDNHGNVTADPQGSMSIAWNILDLPRMLTSGSAATSRNYLADGTLAQTGDGTTTRLYLGDMVFTRAGSSGTPVLESAGWEGGRLINGSGMGNVLYYVTDHLGSVRVVKDGAGAIRQRFDYYPYGTVSRVWTSSSTTDNSEKRYRFGGKEIAGTALTDLTGSGAAPGAPYLDFGARLFSPMTASWLSVDPMAEKYYGIGPLTYCAGSPLNQVDLDGKKWYSLSTEGGINLVNPIDEGFDILFVAPTGDEDIENMPYFVLNDTNILSTLEGNKKGEARGVITNDPDVSKLFYFLADNSNVEWALYSYDNEKYHLGTKRVESSSGNPSDYGVKKPVVKIHSHPLVGIDTNAELHSMGKSWNPQTHKYELITQSDIDNTSVDIRFNGVNATKSYVYFPNTKHLYVLRPDPKLL